MVKGMGVGDGSEARKVFWGFLPRALNAVCDRDLKC